MQEQPTPPPKPQEGQEQQADTTAWLTRRRLVRLGWISAGLIAVGGQLWLLLKLFFAPIHARGRQRTVCSRHSRCVTHG